MPRHFLAWPLCLALLASCNKQADNAPPTKGLTPTPPVAQKFLEVPPEPPKLGAVAYRPEFTFTKLKPASAGTAFVIQSKAGDKYLLTAAHLFDPPEWAQLKTVVLRDFKGAPLGESLGQPIYVGKKMDMSRSETEFDLVVLKLKPGDQATPLKLAPVYPNQNRLWAVGSEVTSRDGLQRTFELTPKMVLNGTTVLCDKATRFKLQAFSGGPIVDHEGAVVANLLGGSETGVVGMSVASLRKRLGEKGVEVE